MMAALTCALLFGIGAAPLGMAHAATPRDLFPIHQERKVGYIDQTGAVVIPPRFTAAFAFAEGRAAFEENDQTGYIDESGATVIPPQFEFGAFAFHEGLAAV